MKKLVLIIFVLLIGSIVKADMTNQSDNYKIYRTQLDEMHKYERYKTVEIFKHNNVIAILSLCDLDGRYEMRLFCFDGDSWVKSSMPSVAPFFQKWHFITVNGRLEAYSICNMAEEAVLSFYALDEKNQLSNTPAKILTLKNNTKYFPNERHREYLSVVEVDHNELFVVGDYDEFRLNPISLLMAITSGGHGLSLKRLFGMRIRDNQILGQYNLPEDIENNDYAILSSIIKNDNNIFIGWIKEREYALFEPYKWMCAKYDLNKRCWEKPIELFRGINTGGEYSGPFFAIDGNNNLHSVLSYTKSQDERKKETNEGSGVFYKNVYDTSKLKTITSALSTVPKIVIDKSGELNIFWTQNKFSGTQESGLFHWQADVNKIDLLIPEEQTGPLDVAVDNNNDIHVIYIKISKYPRITSLEYVKIMKNE